jgi:hypothetical protein
VRAFNPRLTFSDRDGNLEVRLRGCLLARAAPRFQKVIAQDKAILEVMDVGDVDRDIPAIDNGEVAIGGRFAEPDFEEIGGFGISDADRESLICVGYDYIVHFDNLGQRRGALEAFAVSQE